MYLYSEKKLRAVQICNCKKILQIENGCYDLAGIAFAEEENIKKIADLTILLFLKYAQTKQGFDDFVDHKNCTKGIIDIFWRREFCE